MKEDNQIAVTVFSSGNEALVAVAKSLLDDAGIEYIVRNEETQNLVGFGVLGTGYNPVIGPTVIQVLESKEEEAKKVLEELREEEGNTDETDESIK
jgi:hypothetical protein